METQLTKEIKRQIRLFRPALSSSLRTIRWAEEVRTDIGYVDVIRFEDYITKDNSYCGRQQCKIEGNTFPCKQCRGCVFKKHHYDLGILTTCFEVKISVSDFKSKNGHNFHGNRNYYVVPNDIFSDINSLVPPEIGIIVFYPKSGHMTVKKESVHREIDPETLSLLLYNALKKWVDGTQATEIGAEISHLSEKGGHQKNE